MKVTVVTSGALVVGTGAVHVIRDGEPAPDGRDVVVEVAGGRERGGPAG